MSSLPRYVRNAAFYCIVLLGGLLSLVSIVVLPDLRVASVVVPPELSADSLRASMLAAADQSAKRHEAPLPLQMDSAAVAALAKDTTRAGRVLFSLYQDKQSLVPQWEARRTTLAAENRQAAQVAALAYRAEATRPGDRDRLLRFQKLRTWHHEQTRGADAYLDSVRARLGDLNAALLALRDTPEAAADPVRIGDFRARLRLAQRQVSLGYTFAPAPAWTDPQLVEGWLSWHPVSAPSGWLRSYRSLELTSVIGMLGLALLGAAVSSFVRRQQTGSGAETPIGSNLTGLIFTGTTAAFATYLAVKGSLAVVATDGAQANPYVLLLTCFVAAVYWEDAWARVRRLVSGEEPEKGQKSAPREPTPASTPQQPRRQVQMGGATVADAAAENGSGSPAASS